MKGIDSLPPAQEIAGDEIFIPEERLPPLQKDHYYLFQIIGCLVVTRSGKRVGKVKDILSITDNPLLLVGQGEREVLVPFTRKICVEVDVERKNVVIDPPEGLLELNEI